MNILKASHRKEDNDKNRSEILARLLQSSNHIQGGDLKAISTEDLKLLFDLYDEVFFAYWFRDNFKGKMKFSFSRRMTRSAGLTLCPKHIAKIKPEELVLEIRLGIDFFFQYNQVEGSKSVCGVKTSNSLEALLLVFEHELCHVMEFLQFHTSSCRKDRFKAIANSWFGHTESYHKLPTRKQIASQKLGLCIGDTVSFTFEGRRLTGILYNINKRATVMVRDLKGPLADKQGKRYCKYYVPLAHIER